MSDTLTCSHHAILLHQDGTRQCLTCGLENPPSPLVEHRPCLCHDPAVFGHICPH